MVTRIRFAFALATLLPLVGCGGGTEKNDGGQLDLRTASKDGPTQDMAGKDMTSTKSDGAVDAGPKMDGSADMTSTADMTSSADMTALPDLAVPDFSMAADLASNDDLASNNDFASTDLATPDLAGADLSSPDLVMPPVLTFLAVRVGDGQAALTNASTAGFVEVHKLDGTMVGNPIALPVAAVNANQPITFAGNSTSEGDITLSTDGHYATLAGYAVAPGTASVGTSKVNAVARVIGRIDAAGNLDTTTRITDGYDGGNIRSALTQDGTFFWTGGTSSAATGGIHYVQFGAMTSVQVLAAPNNVRWPRIFFGQLYSSSSSMTFTNVYTVGTGIPITANQTATTLNGFPTSAASPYGYVLFDRDINVNGPDTLYVADDSAIAKNGGIQKWTFDGAKWTQVPFVTGLAIGVRGLTGLVIGNSVTLIGSTGDSNNLITVVDDGVSMVQTIATAPANTAYRGVALSPN